MTIVTFNDRTDNLDEVAQRIERIIKNKSERRTVAIWHKHAKFPYPVIGQSGRFFPGGLPEGLPLPPPGLVR